MSFLLTQELADRAVAMALPAVVRLLEDGTFKRKHLHIVVGNPCIHTVLDQDRWLTLGILHEHSIGDPATWEAPFRDIARSKCYITWRNGMPSQIIQTRAPWLLAQGDTVYYGSAYADGLAVAASGVQPWFDQMVSDWVLAACRGLCIGAHAAYTADPAVRFFAPQ